LNKQYLGGYILNDLMLFVQNYSFGRTGEQGTVLSFIEENI